jgi:hypothetical protein
MNMTDTLRPHTAIDAAMNSGSWSEMVKGIETSKKTLPWAKDDFVPTRRIPLPERKHMERALNPVTMTYRDEAREQAHNMAKTDRTQTAVLNRVKKINNTQYNMISHIGPPRKVDSMREMLKEIEPKPTRKWNFVSGLSHEKQATCPILFDAKYMRDNFKPERAFSPPEQEKREFNIINNQFANNHEQRLKQEYATLKEGMVERYWAKHDFDPVIGEYYNDQKEEEFRAKQKTVSSTWGLAQQSRLPEGYARSEGKAYDILTLETKDENKLRLALSRDIKKNNRLQKFKGAPQRLVQDGIKEYDRQENMRLNRVNYKRFEEEIDRGYDFVFTTNGSITANNINHLRPQKVGTGFELVTVNGSAGDGSARAQQQQQQQQQQMMMMGGGGGSGMHSARDITPRSRAVLTGNQAPSSARSTGRAQNSSRAGRVPSLDLTQAGPQSGGGVRTGGLSSYE